MTGKNYYDLLPASFHKPMSIFHNNMLDTPCGAYVADVIGTTAGTRYIHHTLQLPAADEAGNICYLIAFGLARRPYGDQGIRTETSHQPSNIKELFYIDLGAGMPSAYIKDFEFHAPAKSRDKRKTSTSTQ
ncbi:hypothetical protein [Kordiimonas sp.]|uniref:hypothetical protein n=1 Tax=Kordiimonas sp. TaxID=1970157 RepID=UPI003A8DA9D4